MVAKQNRLNPREHFTWRKAWAWVLLGPFNPASWMAILVFAKSADPFSLAAFLTLWPCMLGAGIGLIGLKERQIASGDLAGFIAGWAFFTIPIYTYVSVCVGALYFSFLEVGGLEIAQLQIFLIGLFYALSMLPFAFIYGFVPATCAGLMAYAVTRWLLFARATRQSATPSQFLVASSER